VLVELQARLADWERAAMHLGRAIVAYSVAFLLWLLFLVAFLPASEMIHAEPLPQVIALLFLGAMAVEAAWGTLDLLRFAWLSGGGLLRLAALELAIALDAVLLYPPLHALSPTLGLALLVTSAALAGAALLAHIEVVEGALARRLRARPRGA